MNTIPLNKLRNKDLIMRHRQIERRLYSEIYNRNEHYLETELLAFEQEILSRMNQPDEVKLEVK